MRSRLKPTWRARSASRSRRRWNARSLWGARLATHGSLRPTIARTFVFDNITDAHRLIETGEQIGKIVVTV
jgi:NADPH:quinone reductase-like Zn-dependent oxidoreductase